MPITIYHNPRCGTSRNVLAILRQSGETPEVIEYLRDPPSRDTLLALIAATGRPARELLRQKEALCAELHLDDPDVGDEALVDAMLAHPILINRPIVVTDKGAALCRPADTVVSLLANPPAHYTRDDGEVVPLPSGIDGRHHVASGDQPPGTFGAGMRSR